MRYFHHVVSHRNSFVVDGLSAFPGEITSRIVNDIMWAGSREHLTQRVYERDFDAVWRLVYDGDVKAGNRFTPAELRMLIAFRHWLQRLETDEGAASGSSFVMGNLNDGAFLLFIGGGECDEDQAMSSNSLSQENWNEWLELQGGGPL
jgi:hypothetical protein